LITNNHILLRENLSVDNVLLVPRMGMLASRSDIQLYPFLYSSPMDTVTGYDLASSLNMAGHIPVVSRTLKEDWEKSINLVKQEKLVFLAVGPQDASLHRLLNLLNKEPNLKVAVAIDIAHGHSIIGRQITRLLRELPQVVEIMSGSICTAEAALDCINWGCTHLRCGIGNGSLCTTRLQTKIGFPGLSAVYRIFEATKHLHTHIIADGGIRSPGDAVAYLAAGATGVMLGKGFVRCKESAGWVDGLKHYRGQASQSFQIENGKEAKYIEGEIGPEISPQGTVQDVVSQYEAGIKSAISYLGLSSLSELQPENVEFIRQITSGYIEGTPHGLSRSSW